MSQKSGIRAESENGERLKAQGHLTLEEVDKKLGKSLYDYEIDPAEEECSGACMT